MLLSQGTHFIMGARKKDIRGGARQTLRGIKLVPFAGGAYAAMRRPYPLAGIIYEKSIVQ